MGQRARRPRVAAVQPIEGAIGLHARKGKLRGHGEGDVIKTRGAREIALGIVAFERNGGQRRAAGQLEDCAQQDRFPGHLAAVARGQIVDQATCDIAVR
jgi:hypothetical protein